MAETMARARAPERRRSEQLLRVTTVTFAMAFSWFTALFEIAADLAFGLAGLGVLRER
jgi:hypothetical protein